MAKSPENKDKYYSSSLEAVFVWCSEKKKSWCGQMWAETESDLKLVWK